MSRARWWEVSGVFDGWKLVKHTLKASTPDMARKKVRAKYKRGALAGFPLDVRETAAPCCNHKTTKACAWPDCAALAKVQP